MPGPDGKHDSGALRQFATEIGVKYQTLRRYRQISAAWPPANRYQDRSFKWHVQNAEREPRNLRGKKGDP
jgi:hypothetical protein